MKTNESIYETYKRVICRNCKNKSMNFCNIRRRMDGTLFCSYYDKEEKIEGYKDKTKLFITARKRKSIMKGI